MINSLAVIPNFATNLLLAVTRLSEFTLMHWAVAIIVLAGAAAIVVITLKWMEVTIPPPVIKILWVLLAVIVGVVAIKFLWGLL